MHDTKLNRQEILQYIHKQKSVDVNTHTLRNINHDSEIRSRKTCQLLFIASIR